MKILLTNSSLIGNKGAAAMIESAMRIITKAFGEENLEFFIIHYQTDEVEKLKDRFGISKIFYDTGNMVDISKLLLWYLLNCFKINLKYLLRSKFIQAFQEADLVLDLSGISYYRQKAIKVFESSKWSIVPLLLGKKYVKFIQSIGPFESFFNKLIAKLVLRNIQVIMPRGNISENALIDLKVPKDQIFLFPDSSYILESEEVPDLKNEFLKFKQNKRVIGLSASVVCQRFSKEYIPEMSKFINMILDTYAEFKIAFILHTDTTHLKSGDYKVNTEIMNNIKYKDRVILIETDKSDAKQIKYLIGMCDFFIGSRFHSLMASVSMKVPSLCIGWHYKYYELMNWVDLIDYVRDVKDKYTALEFFKLFQQLYDNEKPVREKLKTNVPVLKEKVWQSGKIIKNYFERN